MGLELRLTFTGRRLRLCSYHGPFQALAEPWLGQLKEQLRACGGRVEQALALGRRLEGAAELPERFVADVVFDRVRGPVVLELNPLYCSGFNVPQAHAQVVTLLAQDLLSLEAPDVIDQASGEGW